MLGTGIRIAVSSRVRLEGLTQGDHVIVTARLRGAEWVDAAPRIVFMTAHQSVEEFVPFLKEVNVPVLQKPFSVEELRSTVARIAAQRSHETLPTPTGLIR